MEECHKVASTLVDALNKEYAEKTLEGSDLLKGLSIFLQKTMQCSPQFEEIFSPLLTPFHIAAQNAAPDDTPDPHHDAPDPHHA